MVLLVSREGPGSCEENRSPGAVARVDREARRVVQPMVEVASSRIAELAPQAKAPVGERRALDLEAQRALTRLLAPAELGRVLGGGGEQEPRLVTELERDPR